MDVTEKELAYVDEKFFCSIKDLRVNSSNRNRIHVCTKYLTSHSKEENLRSHLFICLRKDAFILKFPADDRFAEKPKSHEKSDVSYLLWNL